MPSRVFGFQSWTLYYCSPGIDPFWLTYFITWQEVHEKCLHISGKAGLKGLAELTMEKGGRRATSPSSHSFLFQLYCPLSYRWSSSASQPWNTVILWYPNGRFILKIGVTNIHLINSSWTQGISADQIMRAPHQILKPEPYPESYFLSSMGILSFVATIRKS